VFGQSGVEFKNYRRSVEMKKGA